jgi:hypothetical protein
LYYDGEGDVGSKTTCKHLPLFTFPLFTRINKEGGALIFQIFILLGFMASKIKKPRILSGLFRVKGGFLSKPDLRGPIRGPAEAGTLVQMQLVLKSGVDIVRGACPIRFGVDKKLGDGEPMRRC